MQALGRGGTGTFFSPEGAVDDEEERTYMSLAFGAMICDVDRAFVRDLKDGMLDE